LEKVAAGIGNKLAFIFQAITTLITGLIVGFVYLWQLTLVIIGCAPVFIIASGFVQYVIDYKKTIVKTIFIDC